MTNGTATSVDHDFLLLIGTAQWNIRRILGFGTRHWTSFGAAGTIAAMNMLMERYADIILSRALRLEKGDVLSINAEEENSEFAHLIARKARAITGNGSYIQNLENGKVTATEEAATDYPIEKKPTALLHLPVYRQYEEAERGKLMSAPEIQRYRHLADPLDNAVPAIPFATAPVPSDAWGRVLDEEGGISLPSSLIADLLGLEEDGYASADDDADILIYEKDRLNGMKLAGGRIEDEEGTDLEFSFLPGSRFATTVSVLRSGRKFIPTIYASDIFRALEKSSANGVFTASRPFMLFGRIIGSFSARVENGRIVDITGSDEALRLFEIFLAQDQNAGALSELSLAEESGRASCIDCFALPEWDRMRSTSLTLGGPRPESLGSDEARRAANDCLITLSIPIGTDTMSICCRTEDGEEITVMEDGYIREE